MKKIVFVLMVGTGVLAAAAPLLAQAAADPPQPAAPAEQPADQGALLNSIRQAPDPSAAINAYAKAQATAPDDLAVERAYVERMVSFGLPEMAETQAQDITRRDPNHGLAWAVVAYMNAKRKQTAAALTAITVAVKRAPDDAFVLRSAGELVAWYDTRADKAQIPESVKQWTEAMRSDLAQREAYADAYKQARESYQRLAADADKAPEPRAEQGAGPAVVPEQGGAAYGGQTLVPSGGAYPTPAYTDPYAYVAYPGYAYYPAYWYPSAIYSDLWWWPSFGVSLGFSDFHRHRHHHHSFHRDSFFRHHKDSFRHNDFSSRHRFGSHGRSGFHRDGPFVRSGLGDRNRGLVRNDVNIGARGGIAARSRTRPRAGRPSAPRKRRARPGVSRRSPAPWMPKPWPGRIRAVTASAGQGSVTRTTGPAGPRRPCRYSPKCPATRALARPILPPGSPRRPTMSRPAARSA
jgi:hypothetical protein